MIKTPASVENSFQRGIGAKFCGVFSIVANHSNFIKKHTGQIINKASLVYLKVCTVYLKVCTVYPKVRTVLPKPHTVLPKVRTVYPKPCTVLPKGSTSLLKIVSIYVSIVYQLFKSYFQFINLRNVYKIKYSVYNVRGLHFNLNFVNYIYLRIQFIIFSLLLNLKHEYWFQSDYFN